MLGIETSCDENAVAVVADGKHLLANAVFSQIGLHRAYGGVVPEVAARSHIEVMIPTLESALDQAQLGWDQIDAIAVSKGPGLGGSLLIGVLTARTLAVIKDKPLYGVHHALGHVYANFIDWTENPGRFKFTGGSDRYRAPRFPLLALIVSGGHSHLLLMRSHQDYRLLGETLDDAVGEAFDKVAKILGLPYPGGPSIEAAAATGDPRRYQLPQAQLSSAYDFSFSGLKTAVLRAVQKEIGVDYSYPSYKLSDKLSSRQISDFAASFQSCAVRTLVAAVSEACRAFAPRDVVIAGGVAANRELRRQLSRELNRELIYAPIQLCTDNAAMIASLGYFRSKYADSDDPFSLEIDTAMRLEPLTGESDKLDAKAESNGSANANTADS